MIICRCFQNQIILLILFIYIIKTMHRQRPLQNSMFLPDQHHKPNTQYQSHPNTLKKSSTFNNSSEPHHPYFVSPNHITNIGNTPRPIHREELRENTHHKSLEITLNQIKERMEQISRVVDKHEIQLSSQSGEVDKTQQMTKVLINKVKQSINKSAIGNDVYEHILNIKMEIKDIKEQITKSVKETQLKKVQSSLKELFNQQSRKMIENKGTDGFSGELLKKRDQYFQNLIANLQTEFSFLKKHVRSQSLDFKVSPIASSSTIMLKYQELFKARTNKQMDIVISEYTYYIDSDGYLLDGHSRYIVDQKGKKVKLEQKHLNILKNQKILQ